MLDVDSHLQFRCRRVLCVAGLEGQDAGLLQQAQEVAARSGAELILLHVVPEVSEGLLMFGIEGSGGRPLSVQLAREKLAELTASIPMPVTTSVMIGPPAKCIGLAAREHAADLVIAPRVARHARFERGGAYTADLGASLSRLNCPMLTVPVGVSLHPRKARADVREQRELSRISS
jgi:hypothetical protein